MIRTKAAYQRIIKTNDGRSFHDLEKMRMEADPENKTFQAAELYANGLAMVFMYKAQEPSAFGHQAAARKFKDKYDRDQHKLFSSLLDSACDLLGASKFELYNEAIEVDLFEKYESNLAGDRAIIKRFKELASLKILAEGYKNLREFEQEFFLRNPLSIEWRRKNIIEQNKY